MQLTNGNEGRYVFGFEYAFDDGYYHFGHDGGNYVKLRYYFNPNNKGNNYTLVYENIGNDYDVWTDIFADSLMARKLN